MKITWINEHNGRMPGGFMTLRSHREADGTVRLILYFPAYAAASLGLKRGERLLVGLDEQGTRLLFKPTLFGGNVLKGRSVDDSLQCMVTLPLQNLPKPQAVREDEVVITSDQVMVPFTFDCAPFVGFQRPRRLVAAA